MIFTQVTIITYEPVSKFFIISLSSVYPSLSPLFSQSILLPRHTSDHVIHLPPPTTFLCPSTGLVIKLEHPHYYGSHHGISQASLFSMPLLSAPTHIHTAPEPHCWILFSSSNTPDLYVLTTGLLTCWPFPLECSVPPHPHRANSTPSFSSQLHITFNSKKLSLNPQLKIQDPY